MINLNTGVALSQTTVNEITNTNTTVTNSETTINEVDEEILQEFHHNTKIFPENSGIALTLTAGPVANAFDGDVWGRLTDEDGNHFDEMFTRHPTWDRHLSAIVMEDASARDKVYHLEISYGDSRTMVTRMRFIAGNTKAGATNRTAVRAVHVPAGERIYYHMMCETANATLEVHLRAHCHEPDEGVSYANTH